MPLYRPADAERDGAERQMSPYRYATAPCVEDQCPGGARCRLRSISGTHYRTVAMVPVEGS